MREESRLRSCGFQRFFFWGGGEQVSERVDDTRLRSEPRMMESVETLRSCICYLRGSSSRGTEVAIYILTVRNICTFLYIFAN